MALKVDFYVLDGADAQHRLTYACRLIEKAVAQGLTVCVCLPSAAEVSAFDTLLWSFSDRSFVPHAIATDASQAIAATVPQTPVWLALSASIQADVLVNLCAEAPTDFTRYARVADFVDAEPTRREAGRRRFAHYRDAGHPPETHRVNA
jgi:DNA polymerase-3 subunit chi